jgi:anthraniloyl-CoA monooxygenase
MRIVVIGGGPAGLYFAALMKKADPAHEITVLERNAPDATFGWGVVFSEETLGAFRDADRETYDEITDTFAKWTAIDVKFRGETIRSRGHNFSAIARTRLLEVMQRRCAGLGVDLRFHQEVDEDVLASARRDADLVVGADGVSSLVRRLHQDAFRPETKVHSTKYAWFGTDLVFKAFTFIFREDEHGLFQVHGYPFDAHMSTFIVECPGETWHRAGLDQATEEESIAYCEKLFEEDLAGHRLLSNRSIWMSFVTLRNETWRDGNVAILGDAAHTAHFTIGSGTKLAMEDSVALADALQRHPDDLGAALTWFEMERQPMVERLQQAALESSTYFENVRRYAAFEPIQFAFNLLTRSGRISHLNLEMRDPAFAQSVDRWFAAEASEEPVGPRPVLAPPPAFAPLRLRECDMANRVTVAAASLDDGEDGRPSADLSRRMAISSAGAGLILTEFVSISPEGRITPGTPGLWNETLGAAWHSVVEAIHARGGGSPDRPAIGIRLGHAGRRGATRPRITGADRALRSGGWPLVSASALPYTRHSEVPKELAWADVSGIIEEFAAAAIRAADAGFDLLELDMSHGYLLASFLSPLSNRRTDRFGGTPQNRLVFPLRVLEGVRNVWPAERPLAVRLTATDWVPGGFDVDDAVAVASILRERGCDLVHVVAGQTVEHDRPEFGRFSLVAASDRIRNEAAMPTLVGGNLTTLDDVNTILAAGRADLCVLDLRR